MDALQFRVPLDGLTRRALLRAVLLLNFLFAVTTSIFIILWEQKDQLSPGLQWFTRYVVVQGHLGTENVVAVWYSSMLLLSVAALSIMAWVADGRTRQGILRHGWLAFAAVFALLSMDELGSVHERVGMIPVHGRVVGWIYVLALPIGLVALFMVGFALLHLRRVPPAFTLVCIGVGLYVLNPFMEAVELAMIRSGAANRLWLRLARLLLEEVGLELTGALCFAAGVWLYVARRAGETLEWVVPRRTVRLVGWLTLAFLLAPARASLWINDALPSGAPGMLQNWFPAAAWMLVAAMAITAVSQRRWQSVLVAVAAAGASAFFGVGLYLYSDMLASRASWAVPTVATFSAGLTLEAMVGGYLFSFSPRSSTASPTLRRPRPNPS